MLEVQSQNDELISVSGAIEIVNIQGLRKELEGRIQAKKSSTLDIDLSKLETFDSSVVSLLLCLLRKANKVNCMLRFIDLPDGLLAMARVGGLESILSEHSA